MRLSYTALSLALCLSFAARGFAADEKIRGVLEKTAKTDASAQMTDALNDLYYLAKNDATEKMVAAYLGKNQKVVVTGIVESKPNEPQFFVNVKTVEPFEAKLPPAPPPPPPPPAAPVVEKKDEPKGPVKPEEFKPVEPKKADEKKEDVKEVKAPADPKKADSAK